MRLNTLLSAALLILVAALPLPASQTDALAQSLIELREEVEALHGALDDQKEHYLARMKSLSAQRSDLEGTIAREELKSAQLKSSLAKIQTRIAQKSAAGVTLKPLALEGIALIKQIIETQLPFKQTERLKELSDLAAAIEENRMIPQKALSRVWAIYEDNFRMSHENGIFRQNVTLGGKEYLADVVRLGTMFMYFKTSDEKMGYFARQAQGFIPVEIVDSQAKKQITALFDSMKKQIRSGYFVLPYALKGE